MATLNDVAKKANVSVSTVSRVLNNLSEKFRISKDTEDLVLKVAESLNYRPNRLARSLRLKRTNTIGMVVPDISNPFFAYETRIIQQFASQMGYSLIICNTNEDINVEIEQIELLRSKGVDGFLLMPVGTKSKHIEQLLKDKIPLVLIDRIFGHLSTNSVLVDNYIGAFKAIEHLIQNGHKDIAIIKGLPNTYTSNERFRGYSDALKKYNIRVNPSLVVGKDFRKENGYIETKLLLNLDPRPTALFTTSDLITLGALQAILEEKIRVPQDLSIVCFDEIDFAPFLFTPLTTINQPKDLMGEIAVNLLIENIKNKSQSEEKRIILKPKLMVRKSVAHIGEVIPEYTE